MDLQKKYVEDSTEIYINEDIDDLIETLRDLRAKGYERIEVESYEQYGSITTETKAIKRRLETDEELEARVQRTKHYENVERQQYERLKAKFEPNPLQPNP